MTDTEKLIADLRHHAEAFRTGVAFTDVSAMSTVNVMNQAADYIERGYMKEDGGSK